MHQRAVQLRRDQVKPERYQFTRNLKIFDGLRAVSIIYICYGFTYLMAEYGIIQNPQYINTTRKDFWFTFVTGGFFSVSVMIFISGFLLTYSVSTADQPMSGKSILLYYAKRLLKLMPFNAFVILFGTYFLPTQGNGPYYAKIEEAFKPCQTYWWTNVIYINNFYPVKYDDKCLPNSWFLACIVQMSLFVPVIVAL